MNSNTVEMTAIFQRERTVKNDGTPQRWIVGEAAIKDGARTKYVTLTGECQAGDLRPNVEYRFAGRWKTHPKFGTSFAFDSFAQPEPITREAIVGYLTQAPKIGMMRAEKIYNTLGHDCIAKIKTNPEVLRKIPGLTNVHRKEIQSFLCDKESKEQSTLELQSLLKGHGFPRRIYAWLDKDFGTAAASLIRVNPYILTKYRGVGFELADKVYQQLGLSLTALLRQWNYLVYLVASDSNGSTWLPQEHLFTSLKDKIGQDAMPVEASEAAVLHGALTFKTDNDSCYFGLPRIAACEADVVRWVYEHCKLPSRWAKELGTADGLGDGRPQTADGSRGDIENPLAFAANCGLLSAVSAPSEHQLQAYCAATQTAVGLLVGSPGTGKTWLVGRIIDTIQRSGDTYAVCAPTGKAALRVMESLKAQGVSVMATTIHKLLCPQVGREGWEFTFGADCKLPYDFIIVDESSMIDIGLLKSLLDAVKDGANVLFVGDHEQLPPVGKGAPLRDMIKSGVPCGSLSEIRRNAGEIVKACAAIRDKMPLAPMPRNFEAEDNLIFCRQAPLQENTFATVKSILEFERTQNESFDPLLDCQIIVALNESSQVSRKALNPLLQDYFNPSPLAAEDIVLGEHVSRVKKFRRGDKIICATNGYATSEDGKQVYTANGEIGIVKDFAAASLHVIVNGQTILVPTYGDWSESDFDLGYAISCHRSQGSEWQIVIVILDAAYGARMICDRHWIYTGISRAKRRCYLIGQPDTLEAMRRVSNMWNRKTLFAEQFSHLKWQYLNEAYQSKTEIQRKETES